MIWKHRNWPRFNSQATQILLFATIALFSRRMSTAHEGCQKPDNIKKKKTVLDIFHRRRPKRPKRPYITAEISYFGSCRGASRAKRVTRPPAATVAQIERKSWGRYDYGSLKHSRVMPPNTPAPRPRQYKYCQCLVIILIVIFTISFLEEKHFRKCV